MSKHGTASPGEAILESMEWLKMDKAEFARRLGISEEMLTRLIQGEERLSREITLALESVTGSPAAFWKMLDSKFQRRKLENV